MKARLVKFGQLEIDGQAYDYDVVIDEGQIKKRKKKASRQYKDLHGGHTPLSVEENIPWGGTQLIIGTGAYGSLPVMDTVFAEAEQRGVTVIAVPTAEACKLLKDLGDNEIHAVLHITC